VSLSVERWLGRLRPETARVSRRYFERWLEWLRGQGGRWAGVTPDELVEMQRGAVGDERFAILDMVQAYVRRLEGRVGYKRRFYTALRSFFLHNRAELPLDRSFRLNPTRQKVRGALTVDELRRIVETSTPMYRALFLCMFQAGMGIGEALYWSETGFESVRRQLRSGEPLLKIELPGRKKARFERPYYTFIGRDAVDALRGWLKVRPDVESRHIFITAKRTPISYTAVQSYWMRRCKRLGLIAKPEGAGKHTRYGKNLHEMRDLFRTRWQKSGAAPEVAEFALGHVVDPLGYNKAMRDPDYVADEYLKAEPWLNVVSEEPEKVHVRELHQLRREYDQRLAKMREEIMAEVERQLEELQRMKREL